MKHVRRAIEQASCWGEHDPAGVVASVGMKSLGYASICPQACGAHVLAAPGTRLGRYNSYGHTGSSRFSTVGGRFLASERLPAEAGVALFNDSGLVSFLNKSDQDNYYGIDDFTFTSNPSLLCAYPFNGNFFCETGVSASALMVITQPGAVCCNQTRRWSGHNGDRGR